MKGITLSAFSNRTDILMEFSDDFIPNLESLEKTSVDLIVEQQNRSMSFDVMITATVDDPQLNDSATISVQINDNVTNQVEYVRDFVQLNPECLELTEAVEQAQQLLSLGDQKKAQVVLNMALEQCKHLLRAKQFNVERPKPISMLESFLRNPYTMYFSVAFFLSMLATVAYLLYNEYKWY